MVPRFLCCKVSRGHCFVLAAPFELDLDVGILVRVFVLGFLAFVLLESGFAAFFKFGGTAQFKFGGTADGCFLEHRLVGLLFDALFRRMLHAGRRQRLLCLVFDLCRVKLVDLVEEPGVELFPLNHFGVSVSEGSADT